MAGYLVFKARSIDCVLTNFSLNIVLYSYRSWRFFWISDTSTVEFPLDSATNNVVNEQRRGIFYQLHISVFFFYHKRITWVARSSREIPDIVSKLEGKAIIRRNLPGKAGGRGILSSSKLFTGSDKRFPTWVNIINLISCATKTMRNKDACNTG